MTTPRATSAGPVAAIDVGTNTILMLVAEARPGVALHVLEDLCRTARLGEGLAATGRLSEAGIERSLRVLGELDARRRELGVPDRRTRLAGTAVLRRAADARRFVERARSELGLEVEVLSEDEEARLSFLAVAAESPDRRVAVVDVGGGSTEVVTAGGAERVSAPIGALVLTEAYLGLGGAAPRRAGGWSALIDEVRERALAFPAGAGAREGVEVVLLGGTAANLACLERREPRFDPAAAEGHRLDARAARDFAERLRGLPLEGRLELPIEPERAEILPAGLACAAAALERLGAPRLRASGRGLRFGLAREMLRDPSLA